MNKQNHIEQDILERASLRENPYSLPQGYFAMVEDSVQKRIHNQESAIPQNRLVEMLKPCLMLAITFGVIFGLGYGAMYVTGTTSQNEERPLIVQESSNDESSNQLEDDSFFDTVPSITIIESLAEAESDDSFSEFENDQANKDNIEQYLIESNISLITLASLE
ncbi:MAG: hypothetical protein IKD16_04680 [Bacteroidales bacterium]|nr:hypothetical protein [Bacteroidales bacterium]